MKDQASSAVSNFSQNVQPNSNIGHPIPEDTTSSDTGGAAAGYLNDRKIFVGGLSKEITEGDLQDYFRKFGSIQESTIIRNAITGESKNYGFIIFDSTESYKKVFNTKDDHIINNHWVNVEAVKVRNNKVFVHGISNEITDEDIKKSFGQFGTISGVRMQFDKLTNQRKNYCFVFFETEEAATKALNIANLVIKNKEVIIKPAVIKSSRGGTQKFSPSLNAYEFQQNRNQPDGNQTYPEYIFNQQVYNGMYYYSDGAHSGYQNAANRSYEGLPYGGETNRGGSHAAGGGTNRKNGNSRYEPY